jgi:hypothetical protein
MINIMVLDHWSRRRKQTDVRLEVIMVVKIPMFWRTIMVLQNTGIQPAHCMAQEPRKIYLNKQKLQLQKVITLMKNGYCH